MALRSRAGYTRGGLPYNRSGRGCRGLVVFQGLSFENKPQTGALARRLPGPYAFLSDDYTVYVVLRRRGLPSGHTLKDMSDDYADMIRAEMGGPVDVIGVSTGGPIAQHFAADHPDLVRRLVLHSAAHTLNGAARVVQMRVAHLARRGRWGAAYAAMFGHMITGSGPGATMARRAVRAGALLAGLLTAPKGASDLVVTVQAEDKHMFRERLSQIRAPTLVVAGDRDPFYTPELFRETAEGIPNARLVLYPGMGHPASGRRFARDVLEFLTAKGAGRA